MQYGMWNLVYVIQAIMGGVPLLVISGLVRKEEACLEREDGSPCPVHGSRPFMRWVNNFAKTLNGEDAFGLPTALSHWGGELIAWSVFEPYGDEELPLDLFETLNAKMAQDGQVILVEPSGDGVDMVMMHEGVTALGVGNITMVFPGLVSFMNDPELLYIEPEKIAEQLANPWAHKGEIGAVLVNYMFDARSLVEATGMKRAESSTFMVDWEKVRDDNFEHISEVERHHGENVDPEKVDEIREAVLAVLTNGGTDFEAELEALIEQSDEDGES